MTGRRIRDYSFVEDRPGPGLGPLGGLCGALYHGEGRGAAKVLSLPCDALPIPVDLVSQLSGDGPVVVDGNHLIGLWPVTLARTLHGFLSEQDERSMHTWCTHVGAERRTVAGIGNINRLSDLALLHGCGDGLG